jgi:hypothetical protein
MYVFLIIAYVFTSTKLEKRRAEQDLPGTEEGRGGEGGRVCGGEMTQTMCTHLNK